MTAADYKHQNKNQSGCRGVGGGGARARGGGVIPVWNPWSVHLTAVLRIALGNEVKTPSLQLRVSLTLGPVFKTPSTSG